MGKTYKKSFEYRYVTPVEKKKTKKRNRMKKLVKISDGAYFKKQLASDSCGFSLYRSSPDIYKKVNPVKRKYLTKRVLAKRIKEFLKNKFVNNEFDEMSENIIIDEMFEEGWFDSDDKCEIYSLDD